MEPKLTALGPDGLLHGVDELQWRQQPVLQVSASLVYLMRAVEELREENGQLRQLLAQQQQQLLLAGPAGAEPAADEKLAFSAAAVSPRPVADFDPLAPNRRLDLGALVADFANGHGLNGCALAQVVQPITTGVIRKLFEAEADKYTYTEDSVGKGRPARYAKVPTEFVKELSEAICDGFSPSKAQRAQLLPQARTMAGTVARNYFNNARSHRKRSQNSNQDPAQSSAEGTAEPSADSPADSSELLELQCMTVEATSRF